VKGKKPPLLAREGAQQHAFYVQSSDGLGGGIRRLGEPLRWQWFSPASDANYRSIAKNQLRAQPLPLDFVEPPEAAKLINQ